LGKERGCVGGCGRQGRRGGEVGFEGVIDGKKGKCGVYEMMWGEVDGSVRDGI